MNLQITLICLTQYVLLYKSSRTILYVIRKIYWQEKHPGEQPKHHNVEENNGMSKMSGLQPLTTECVENPFFS
jgi:hypothetical protein